MALGGGAAAGTFWRLRGTGGPPATVPAWLVTHTFCLFACLPQIATASAALDGLSSKFVLPLEPWSANVLQLRLGPPPTGDTAAGSTAGASGKLRSGGRDASKSEGGGAVAAA